MGILTVSSCQCVLPGGGADPAGAGADADEPVLVAGAAGDRAGRHGHQGGRRGLEAPPERQDHQRQPRPSAQSTTRMHPPLRLFLDKMHLSCYLLLSGGTASIYVHSVERRAGWGYRASREGSRLTSRPSPPQFLRDPRPVLY